MTQPKYSLFEVANVCMNIDDGVWNAKGLITGVVYEGHQNRKHPWWYQITFTDEVPGSPHIKTPYSELFSEDEIVAVR